MKRKFIISEDFVVKELNESKSEFAIWVWMSDLQLLKEVTSEQIDKNLIIDFFYVGNEKTSEKSVIETKNSKVVLSNNGLIVGIVVNINSLQKNLDELIDFLEKQMKIQNEKEISNNYKIVVKVLSKYRFSLFIPPQ